MENKPTKEDWQRIIDETKESMKKLDINLAVNKGILKTAEEEIKNAPKAKNKAR